MIIYEKAEDFLNRILESEGVESLDELVAERYVEILSDPVAAAVIMDALEAAREPELPPPTQGNVVDTLATEHVSVEPIVCVVYQAGQGYINKS